MSSALDIVKAYPLYFTISTLVYFGSLFLLVEMLRKSKFEVQGRVCEIVCFSSKRADGARRSSLQVARRVWGEE